jgi:hypothetical protein
MSEPLPAPERLHQQAAGWALGVPPLIYRHAEDSAFYWQQIDSSPSRHGLRAQRLLHFARLLSAHLQGLQVAGHAAVAPALAALTRWRKPGEAFAALHVALSCAQTDTLDPTQAQVLGEVFTAIARDPSGLLRGAIGALAAVPEPAAHAWLQSVWAQPNGATTARDITALVAALRACALRAWQVPAEVQATAMAHPQAFVRAAAARTLHNSTQAQPLLEDADLAVRAEAAIALGAMAPRENAQQPAHPASPQRLQAASVLWSCVAAQAEVCAQATGWYQMQSQRRLGRWLGHLAHLAPLGHPDVATLLAFLPLRQSLSFVLHHGDAAHLPFVVQALADPEQARWAGWVWQSLTGIDLIQAGLTLPNPPIDLDAPLTRIQQDADQGLPLPNAEAVRAHPANASLSSGKVLLLGQPRSSAHLAQWLRLEADAPQALRAVAALAWNAQGLSPRIQLRADATTLLRQDAALAALDPAAPLAA